MSYRNVPDDFRRNLFDLECLIEMATHYPDEEGGPDVAHMTTTPARADEIAARLASTPRNVLIVQTKHGRFQITVDDVMTIVCLDAFTGISVRPTSNNTIEVRNF